MAENVSAYKASKVSGGRYADATLTALAAAGGGVSNYARIDLSRARSIECPCCKQSVRVPTLEIIIDHYKVTPLEARILGAIWKGKGHPVQTERIFDAMYVDDPDGGPSPTRMYLAFKVALCHLRARLDGYDPSAPGSVRVREPSGISIENVGYRRGYRLIIGGLE
ncbi:hypothetical protein [Bradyrhizobium cenepequi]